MSIPHCGEPVHRLYRARVMHRRLFPVSYRFAYRVFSLLLDVDRVDELDRATRLFSHNRFNLLSFHDRDHGARDGSAPRPWIDALLARAGIDLDGGRVRLLCFPRVLGYAFNPFCVWYCEHRDGRLRAVLCEVRNTFGEKHGYLLHGDGAALEWPLRRGADKCFHVSPFIGMRARYRFRMREPGERLDLVIREHAPTPEGGEALMLIAAYDGRAAPASDAAFVRAALAMPLMTLKVMLMIHWQALRIWLRGAAFHRKPDPPAEEASS